MALLEADFVRKVYEIVATIPEGKVMTYGQIAEMLGDVALSREVGHAMSHATPALELPCHRVVSRTGTLSPEYAFGGAARQRRMLEEEGITFSSDGCIDMVRHQWSEYEQLTLGW